MLKFQSRDCTSEPSQSSEQHPAPTMADSESSGEELDLENLEDVDEDDDIVPITPLLQSRDDSYVMVTPPQKARDKGRILGKKIF